MFVEIVVASHKLVTDEYEAAKLVGLKPEARIKLAEDAVRKLVAIRAIHLTTEQIRSIAREVEAEISEYGPIQALIEDPEVTEVMVNGHSNIYVERGGRISRHDKVFRDDAHVMRIIERIVHALGRRIDESSPMVDARLPDGSRVNVVIPPVAIDGPTLTVRKFARQPLTAQKLVENGTMSESMRVFLEAAVKAKITMMISGGAGSGKTTTLNALSGYIPAEERIVTIEDAAELQLQQKHVVRLECRPANIEGRGEVTVRHLVRNSLRMRPDRIIVGEVRGGEALDMLQAMNTGHEGSLSTAHANSTRDALARLETMVLMAGTELPSKAIREQISSAIDLIIHQSRLRDGTRRIVQIAEVRNMESGVITMQDVFVYDQKGIDPSTGAVIGEHVPTGFRPIFMDRLVKDGINIRAEDIFGKSRWK
ncbi:MAG: CpaF family protein [Armatimonadetes bacterium]|nr:CpaF family protein [Armatimonadota bacterium]